MTYLEDNSGLLWSVLKHNTVKRHEVKPNLDSVSPIIQKYKVKSD